MVRDSGRTTSVWMATADLPSYPPLHANAHADVCIVGAGIVGMTTAYLLARAGKSVIVLDDGPIGSGMTQRTTAHITHALDTRYGELEELFGERGARLAAESQSAAIARIEATVKTEEIDCDFERVDGYLFLPPGEPVDTLEREQEAARRAGLTEVEFLARAPVQGFDTGPCLRFPRQGQFHPLKYLAGLSRAIERDGGRIYCGTHASEIAGGGPARVNTSDGHTVTADWVVVATNSPVNNLMTIHTKQAPYLTYVIGLRVPRDLVTAALYWDTADPYHYVRVQHLTPDDGGTAAKSYDLLIVGGEDHKTGQANDAEERYARLEAWTRERFPSAGAVEFRWSGQVMEPVDGLGFIGHNPADEDNVCVATGDSGNGMTHGTIAGMLLTDFILGRTNPWAELYDPGRVTKGAASDFLKENLNVAVQFADYLTGSDVSSPDAIARGEGAVLRRGLLKVAVYRDEQGTLHERSAVCVHLGCIVAWNSDDKTWDCPCHGSRYDAFGRVINGPANSDLPAADG